MPKVILAVIAAALAVGGCGLGARTENQRSASKASDEQRLALMLTREFLGKQVGVGDGAKSVDCLHRSGNDYSCVLTVEEGDGPGTPPERYSIMAVFDSKTGRAQYSGPMG
jgi:hypothetical protein